MDVETKLWKNAQFHNVEESFKTFLDPDLEADDIQNLISSSLTHLCYNFREDSFSSFHVKLLTDRETDKRLTLHNLLGRGNKN